MEPFEEADLDALIAWIDTSGMLDPSFRLSDHVDPEKLVAHIVAASPSQSQEKPDEGLSEHPI